VRVFRRRTNEAPDVLDPEQSDEQGTDSGSDSESESRPGFTAAKGKPTPKRSEAEKRRRQPYSAPGDRKAASAQSRDRSRSERVKRMEAARRGEDWALPRKDQGPARKLARDVVDSRRGIGEYYLYGVIVLIVLLFIPGLRGSSIVEYIILILLVTLACEGWYVSRKTTSLARQRLPGVSTHGVGRYAAMRGIQMRRMRVPAPRVKPGDKI
jgi:hypothetical protein